MSALLALIPWEWVAAFGAGVIALAASWLGGRKSAKTAAKLDAAKQELKAHDRINKADTGDDLSDEQRIERLRSIARKLGN